MQRRSPLVLFPSKKPIRRHGATNRRPAAGSLPFSRRLRTEPLEDRRLLSITVNTLIDEADGSIVDGDISLRDAIAVAPAGQMIDFSVTGTIDLYYEQLVIDKNLIISGPGASLLTINARGAPGFPFGGSTRVFRIDDGNTGTLSNVEIRDVTLTGGDPDYQFGPQSGGAIWTNENLVVANCIITGNGTAVPRISLGGGGGIYSSNGAAVPNSLTILDTTISGNVSNAEGGGIRKRYGSLVVERSTISGNTAARIGGGISAANGGINVQIRDSTISDNHVGAAYAYDGGGGLFLFSANATITGSTISGNTAAIYGAGIFTAGFGSLSVRHSTIAFNNADSDNNLTGQGGGLLTGSAILDHTIVAKNTRGGTTEDDVFGEVTANFSLISTTAGATINGANNVLGQDPLLGPLANNGGSSETHALLAGSPAIDMGDPAFVPPPANDQRGAPFMRLADGDGAGGARIDVGAYERQNFNLVVDTLVDENDGDHSASDFSLREAIAFANTNDLVSDAITFAQSLTSGGPATILLTLGELAIHDSMTMDGPGASLLSIDGGDASRIFNVDNGSGTLIDIEIVGLTLTGGNVTAGSGGAIFNSENLMLSESTLSGNSASNRGGGIYNSGGSVAVSGSTITGNEAFAGGGIANSNGNLQVTASTISGNVSIGFGVDGGGGINSMFGSINIIDSTLSGNTSQYQGGGIFHHSGPLTIVNSTLSGNTANNQGGGVYSRLGQLAVRHSTITANQARGMSSDPVRPGGGVMRSGSGAYSTNLEHTIVAGNLGQFSGDDLRGSFTARYSLIGIQTGETFIVDNGGNLVGNPGSPINPQLGPLADNGGPTLTHALLAGSPAIEAGDPAAIPGFMNVPLYDQRGAPFTRANGSRIDIGAVERPPILPAVFGDYNQNGVVDGADYVVWRKTLGTNVAPPFTGADGDGDGSIDQDDYGVWRAHFGQSVPSAGAGSGFAEASSVESQELMAEALSMLRIAADHVGEPVQLSTRPTSAPTDTEAATARAASFALLETRSLWHDLSSRSRGRIHRYSVAESGADDLSLLLAIDRVWQSRRRDPFVSDDSVTDEHRVNDDHSRSLIDQPLDAVLEASP